MPTFIEREEYEFLLRSVRFCEKVDLYSDLLGLSREKVETFKSDNELFNYVFAHQQNYGSLAESFTRYKICNMQMHFAELVYSCKSSPNYTYAIGEELAIGAPVLPLDPNIYTPEITIEYTRDGNPIIRWEKQTFQGVEIWKDSGNGKGYQKLARAYAHEFIDKSPLPALGENAVWKYSIIYLFKNEMVGNWSDEKQAQVFGPDMFSQTEKIEA